jgi:hypothetical protein
MITLKESLLDKTNNKLKTIPTTIKRAQLEAYGFPKFEDHNHGTWTWICPEVFSKYNDKLNKVFGTNHNFIGIYWMDNMSLDDIEDDTEIHIKLLTDKYHSGRDWPSDDRGESVTIANITLRYRESMDGKWDNRIYHDSLKDIYDLLVRFALNMDKMLDDIIKAAKTVDFSHYKRIDIYDDLIKQYKK